MGGRGARKFDCELETSQFSNMNANLGEISNVTHSHVEVTLSEAFAICGAFAQYEILVKSGLNMTTDEISKHTTTDKNQNRRQESDNPPTTRLNDRQHDNRQIP